MKRLATLVLSLGLLIGAGVPASAKAAPATLYLHGRGPATEAYINETWVDSNYMHMDATEPTAAELSSMFVTNYFRGPNTDCDGNGLLPFWRGDLIGKFRGDIKVTLHTVATPSVQMTVSIYPDPTGSCAADGSNPALPAAEAPQPIATDVVDVAPGQAVTEILFENVKLKTVSTLGLQLSIPSQTTPGQVRVLFDSTDYASSIEFLK